ncbi:MAG: hypothetical protein ACK5U7_07555 [Bacteroidota bacterium]
MAQIPAFEPVRIYDTPQIAAAQLLEGEAALSSFKDLFLSPNNLTPEERTSIADSVVDPNDRLSKTFMETVTNPFIWFWFLSSPLGWGAAKAGRSMLEPARRFVSQNKKGLSIFSQFRTYGREFAGSNITETVRAASQRLERVMGGVSPTLARADQEMIEAIEQVAAKRGVKMKWSVEDQLNPYEYTRGSAERDILQEFHDHAAAVASGEYRTKKVRDSLQVKLRAKMFDPEKGVRDIEFEEGIKNNPAGQAAQLRAMADQFRREEEQARKIWYSTKEQDSDGLYGLKKEYEARFDRMKKEEFKTRLEEGRNIPATPFDLYYEDYGRYLVKDQGTMETPWGPTKLDDRSISVEEGNFRMEPQVFEEGVRARFEELYGDAGVKWLTRNAVAQKELYVRAVGREDLWDATKKVDADGTLVGEGDFVIDEDKLTLLANGLHRKLKASGGPNQFADVATLTENVEGMEALLAVSSWDELSRIARTHSAPERRKRVGEVLERLLQPQRSEFFLSKNALKQGRINGQTPHVNLSDAERNMLETAPFAASNMLGGRLAPLTSESILWDPEYLERMQARGLLGKDGERLIKSAKKAIEDSAKNSRPQLVVDSNVSVSRNRYVVGMGRTAAWDTYAAPVHVMKGNDRAISLMNDPGQGAVDYTKRFVPSQHGEEVLDVMHKANEPIMEGETIRQGVKVSVADMADAAMLREADPERQRIMREMLIPNMLHVAGPKYMMRRNQELQNRQAAKWFANSFLGRTIEKFGDTGKGFIGRMREIADPESYMTPRSLSQGVANYLYGTHLGLNLASVVLNLTQPIIGAALHGRLDDAVVAYGKAFGEMADYTKRRISLGLTATMEQKEEAMRAAFKHMGKGTGGVNVLGLSADPHQMIDGVLRANRRETFTDKLQDSLLGLFSASEAMNRSVSAHLFERVNVRAGRQLDASFWEETREFVSMYQFGSGPENTLRIFQENSFAANPLVKMFLTFPLRTTMNAVYETPLIAAGESGTYLKGLAQTTLRGLGLSALTYEVTKGLVGVDISRGLYGEAAPGLLYGPRFTDPNEQIIPLPPVVAIPRDIILGLATEDRRLLSSAIFRLAPAGVALHRMVGLSPEAPEVEGLAGLPGSMQATYVGWNAPLPSGEVPVFKADGKLIEYRTPAEVIARGLGLDLGQWQEQGQLDQYLVKQREEIVKVRNQYINALVGNDPGRADRIRKDFERRFKVPLSVTQADLERALQSQVVGRTERVLDRINPAVRDRYAQMADASGYGRNVPAGLTSGPTATHRDRLTQARDTQAALEVQRRLDAVGGGAVASFDSF